jgi:glycosyltransferase involved in cell wall biosynthesis
MNPLVSVVVIGRNEGERLVCCLRSVLKSDLPDGTLELIYVDSSSTDNSVQKAKSLGWNVVELDVGRPTAARGRNAGWRRANGEFVLFLDGDTILAPAFIKSALAAFEDKNVAVVWGHRRELAPGASIYNRVLDLDWVYRPGNSDFCGGDALMRRTVLELVDGFDEDLIAGEEPEMCRRIRGRGFTILHIDQPMTLHDLAITRWQQYWKRAVRAGHAYAEVADRFRQTPSPLWRDEVRRSRVRAVGLMGLLGGGLLTSLLTQSPWYVMCGFVIFLVLLCSTALKASWKARSPVTLLLYSVHAHLQHLPLMVGQFEYHLRRARNCGPELIEYK